MDVPRVGQLVCSHKGRDKGNYYLITEILDEKYVQVANGSTRKINQPKKKNIKHLKLYPHVDDDLGSRLNSGNTSNEKLVRSINRLLQEVEREE
ncbi:MAG: RNA-binding protein [Candidatus Syntrophonatronum acetioxidans]|uniref:RNA-binding protein n=1 Tax=Candidatus Syntrophonatronum acetioxidans TaxID=1795816 RepID=A0A424YH80_9FIRM|nr:MAG: RNA-binding protein [Candidatus Syntrophonatronum acetioxidans]